MDNDKLLRFSLCKERPRKDIKKKKKKISMVLAKVPLMVKLVRLERKDSLTKINQRVKWLIVVSMKMGTLSLPVVWVS